MSSDTQPNKWPKWPALPHQKLLTWSHPPTVIPWGHHTAFCEMRHWVEEATAKLPHVLLSEPWTTLVPEQRKHSLFGQLPRPDPHYADNFSLQVDCKWNEIPWDYKPQVCPWKSRTYTWRPITFVVWLRKIEHGELKRVARDWMTFTRILNTLIHRMNFIFCNLQQMCWICYFILYCELFIPLNIVLFCCCCCCCSCSYCYYHHHHHQILRK